MTNNGGSSGSAAAGGGGAAAASIPQSAWKSVQSIKEIVEHSSDEEIYAMLKECNMDLNDALQRLLNQDTFQEVKRKRDKKRENKDGSENTKPARGGSSSRGGRYGGRGSSGPRYNSNDGTGRGRGLPRENGYYVKGSEAPASSVTPTLTSSKPTPSKAPMNESSTPVPNTQNGPPRPSPGTRFAFAEVLKSNGAPQPPAQASRLPLTSEPVVDKPIEPGTNKRGIGAVGNQRSTNESDGLVSRSYGAPATSQPAPSDLQKLQSGSTPRNTFSSNRPASQPPVGTQRPSGSVQEWKAKPKPSAPVSAFNRAADTSESTDPQKAPALPSKSCDKEDQSVIIHNQFLVPAGVLSLNFGSLNLGSDDDAITPKPSEEEAEHLEEPDDQPSSSPVSSTPGSVDQNYSVQQTSAMVDNLPSNSEVSAVTIAIPAVTHSEHSKSDGTVQSSHYPYLPAAYGLVPQPGAQYQYESAESQLSDGSRNFSSLHHQYSDPTASYYTPTFRPSVEGDMRYSAKSSRYSGSIASVAGQASESGNTTTSLAQTSQPASGQSVPSLPHQQPLPLHAAYSAQPGLHMGYNMFNYPYLPQSVPYLHPYQHSFAGNSAYPQPPAGNNYPPTNNYPAPTVSGKYPMTQYKPLTAATASTTSATGYAGYSSPTGYAASPTVTMGTTSVYDDVGGPQYKDNNIYLQQSQQAEGSQVWLSRDSYYNIPGQNQHTAYAHAYGSLYHPTQSVPAPNSHQMLQQPQALAAAAGSQGAAYGQQPQRAQQSWTNNY